MNKEILTNHGQTRVVIVGKWANSSQQQIQKEFDEGIKTGQASYAKIEAAVLDAT
jgi:hypothetical protein